LHLRGATGGYFNFLVGLRIMGAKEIKIRIDPERCKGCMFCVMVCPKKVLDKDDKVNERGVQCVIVKAPEECIGCGLCAIMCPDCAIEIEKDQVLGDR